VTVLGRIDDTVTVEGHRLGTMELESAIADVEGVAEAAIVDVQSPGGSTVHAFVSTDEGHQGVEGLRERITENVRRTIGSFATPGVVVFTPGEFPKTRSGKLLRRLLKDIASDQELGDTSALRNPEIVGEIESALDGE